MMIDSLTAYLCALSLLVTALLEIAAISLHGDKLHYISSRTMVVALLMLSGRVAYLAYSGDTARLNMWGMEPLVMIAASRALCCFQILRGKHC